MLFASLKGLGDTFPSGYTIGPSCMSMYGTGHRFLAPDGSGLCVADSQLISQYGSDALTAHNTATVAAQQAAQAALDAERNTHALPAGYEITGSCAGGYMLHYPNGTSQCMTDAQITGLATAPVVNLPSQPISTDPAVVAAAQQIANQYATAQAAAQAAAAQAAAAQTAAQQAAAAQAMAQAQAQLQAVLAAANAQQSAAQAAASIAQQNANAQLLAQQQAAANLAAAQAAGNAAAIAAAQQGQQALAQQQALFNQQQAALQAQLQQAQAAALAAQQQAATLAAAQAAAAAKTGNPIPSATSPTATSDVVGWIEQNPLIVGGAGLLLVVLLMGMGRR